MKNHLTSLLVKLTLVALCWVTVRCSMGNEPSVARVVPIIVSDAAPSPEQVAAQELSQALSELYPTTQCPVANQPRPAQEPNTIAASILLGTPQSTRGLMSHIDAESLRHAESYVVTTAQIDGQPCGLIIGADSAGVVYGVYGLLRKLGCGSLLSGDTLPTPKPGAFSFTQWALADRPLVPTRLVFNWHNFLSGCSTWNLEHWRQWIEQSQKMGYNAVMVHAYGNNPMAGFPFRDIQKPVGFLSSTRVGRDWSTNHVNDVRRLHGGKVFLEPVFGADAAIAGSDMQRTKAAQKLMGGVFTCAARRGVDVYFAVDIDTTTANPQQLIQALPEDARFEIKVPAMSWMGQSEGKAWLADPDSAEGFEFYKAQVAELLTVYPQINCLVAWHRKGSTPWMAFGVEEMPASWQKEYAAELARTPSAEQLWHAPHMFAQAKVVQAFQRALRQLGRKDIRVAFGSWDFNFLPAADRFLPADVALIPLDWMVLKDESIFDTKQRRLEVATVAANRPVIPVAWAHHDDGNYVGRPYTPYADFYDRLAEMKCDTAGYGIIHWTTKPLDLYFSSLADQVWAASKNQPLREACQQMAQHLVGAEQADTFAEYLLAWVTTMPKIGRETSDFFIDHELKDLPAVEAASSIRMSMLRRIDRGRLSTSGRAWHDYFTGLEGYVLGIYRNENALNRAKRAYQAGDLPTARQALAECCPEEIIEQFATFSQQGGLSRGEEGLIVTMNTRWLPHYVRLRQMLGIDAVRYNYAPTSHDPLAQSRGIFTFHFDTRGELWQSLGATETGATQFAIPANSVQSEPGKRDDLQAVYGEICRSGIVSDEAISLAMQPILPNGSRGGFPPAPLAAGSYQLTLLFPTPDKLNADTSVLDLRVTRPVSRSSGVYCFAPIRARYLRLQCRGNNKNRWNSIYELQCDALDRTGSITASGEVAGHAAHLVADADARTRWAVEGSKHWIELPLDPKQPFENITVQWYEGAAREYAFDVLVSNDRRKWSKVEIRKEAGHQQPLVEARIDLSRGADSAERFVAVSYPVELNEPGTMTLTLTPVKGKAVICGAVLEATEKDAGDE